MIWYSRRMLLVSKSVSDMLIRLGRRPLQTPVHNGICVYIVPSIGQLAFYFTVYCRIVYYGGWVYGHDRGYEGVIFDFKDCLTTWGLIRICWRSIAIAWVLSIWQRTMYIMQGWSTLMSGSILFERFLIKETSSYRKFARRRIPLICLPRLFREWSLHIAKNYSISF